MVAANVPRPPNSPDSCNLSGLFFIGGSMAENFVKEEFMNVVEINVDSLIPYESNPRNNDSAVEYVANSIKEFGFKVPIIEPYENVVEMARGYINELGGFEKLAEWGLI